MPPVLRMVSVPAPKSWNGFSHALENGPHHVVALQIDAANLAGAVIEIEIAGEFGVFGGELHGLRDRRSAP